MSDPLDTLYSGLDQLGDLVGRVGPDDLDKPTPCSEWNVSQLLDHTIHSVNGLAVMTRGGQPDFASVPHSQDPVADYRAAAQALRSAWDEASGGDPRFHSAEVATHSWDLAQALGVPSEDLDDAVATDGLAFMSASMTPEMRGDAFAPEREAPEGAGPYERLAAFAGREVS
jgi:uncharacterized protein (TIGR03086 family)